MTKSKWDSFIRKIYIDSSPGKIYPLWATSSGIETWFLRSCGYTSNSGKIRDRNEAAQKNDSFRWYWHNWPTAEEGKVREANGKDLFTFTFANSEVSVDLQHEGLRTLVTLKQYHIPTDDQSKMDIYFGCGTGWSFWLTNLKAYVEHGVLLHHSDPEMMGNHDGFQFVNM